MTFEWIPGKGMDVSALERLKANFSKPTDPPYEAWFMGGKNYHTYFLDLPPEEAADERYFFDTCGGIKNFGRFREWVIWYHYLLPYILVQTINDKSSEYFYLLVNYFINLYPQGAVRDDSHLSEAQRKALLDYTDYAGGITEEYPGFREDILNTLAQGVMEPRFWKGEALDANEVWPEDYPEHGYWHHCFYSTMLFCLMYLSPAEITSWFASMTRISGKLWQHELSIWLTGLRRFLLYYDNPELMEQKRGSQAQDKEITIQDYLELAGFDWADSFLVFGGLSISRNFYDYVPKRNIEILWQEVERHSLEVGNVIDKPTYYIDGNNFTTHEEYFEETMRVLAPGASLTLSTKAFHEIWLGGIGSRNYDDIILVWKNFDESQKHFGYEASAAYWKKQWEEMYLGLTFEDAMQTWYERIKQEHPDWDEPAVQRELSNYQHGYHGSLQAVARAERREGNAIIDWMIKFIRDNPNIELKFEA
jgi:hypothetical protein